MKRILSIIFLSTLIVIFGSQSFASNKKIEKAIDFSAKDKENVIKDRDILNDIGIIYYDDEGYLHVGLKEVIFKKIENKKNLSFELEKVKYSFNDLKQIFKKIEQIIDDSNENDKVKTIELQENKQKIVINSNELSQTLKHSLKEKFTDVIIFESDDNKLQLERFVDILIGDWYFDSIQYLANKNYIKGYLDGNFKPNNYITREEAAQIAYKVAMTPVMEDNTNNKIEFIDVDKNRWSYEAINFLYINNIIKGRTNNMYFPDENMTREEAAVIASRILDYREVPRMENNSQLLEFKDYNEISNWALEDIEILKRNFILKGYGDNSFKPKDKITRAEFSKIMVSLLKKIELTNNI